VDLRLDLETALTVTTSPRKTRPKRPPGPPVEVMIWRLIRKAVGRGDHRKLVDNVGFERWDLFWSYKNPGPGRYRVEFRDAKRAIVKVLHANQMPPQQGGQLVYTQGRTRPPGKRKVPPPSVAWDSSRPTIEQRQRAAQLPPPRPSQGHGQPPARPPASPQRFAQAPPNFGGVPRPAVPTPGVQPSVSQSVAQGRSPGPSGASQPPNQRPLVRETSPPRRT
jgi:hypothetical protein